MVNKCISWHINRTACDVYYVLNNISNILYLSMNIFENINTKLRGTLVSFKRNLSENQYTECTFLFSIKNIFQ